MSSSSSKCGKLYAKIYQGRITNAEPRSYHALGASLHEALDNLNTYLSQHGWEP